MTRPSQLSSPSPHAPRRFALIGLAAAGLVVLSGMATVPVSAAPAGVVWQVAWKAPVTSTGPNRFNGPVVLQGTAKYSLGAVTAVDQSIATAKALPAACGTFPAGGTAALSGNDFTVKPALPCNGTYEVTVVARRGSGALAAKSQPLKAPVTLADPGRAPTGFTGVAQGTSHTVVMSWNADPDPDVVGYRVRRDGVVLADVPNTVRTYSDTVPDEGTYTYDVATLHWGDGGPGSPSIASPTAAPIVARVVDGAPPSTAKPSGSGGSSGGGGSTSTGGGPGSARPSGGGGGSSSSKAPPAPTHANAKAPAGRSASASAPKRRSVDPRVTSTTLDGGYDERLPYEPGTARSKVELADGARTKTVATTVPVRSRHGRGLLVPIAVVVVLLAASLQVRSLLARASRASDG